MRRMEDVGGASERGRGGGKADEAGKVDKAKISFEQKFDEVVAKADKSFDDKKYS